MVEASRQRGLRGLNANPQAVTCVKPDVASSPLPSHPREGNGSAEPLLWWRRPVCSAAGQETWTRHEERGVRDSLVPEKSTNGAGRLPGVSGTACGESARHEPWETPGASQNRRGNHASWRGRRAWGVGAARTSDEGGQCRRSKGAALPRCFHERRGPGPSSIGGLR